MTQEEIERAIKLLAIAVDGLLTPQLEDAKAAALDAADKATGISSTGIGSKSDRQLELEREVGGANATVATLNDLVTRVRALADG